MKHISITVLLLLMLMAAQQLTASSHREAPLIANDPLADNTDLYAFRSPDNPDMITIIANYVPLQLPQGGPNYYSFGEGIRYEIHITNDPTTTDDIIYRYTFQQVNEDPTTFFNIRLGLQNLKTTYTLEKSTDGGATFTTMVTGGVVPPNNIGKRSIEDPVVGLGTSYGALAMSTITTTSDGETIYCGPVDDPFFVDLGGIFDLGDSPRNLPRDGVACMNVSTIAMQIPISELQKDGLSASAATSILDGNFIIGVWASASRQKFRTLGTDGTISDSGDWVQVSRLGMPLTNEAVIPIGDKDDWNRRDAYNVLPSDLDPLYNPELALYMDDDLFGGAVPAFNQLRVQRNSLGGFDFGNTQDGLFPLRGTPAVDGTALSDAAFGPLLLPTAGKPRGADILPIFLTGIPNLRPYQLATGKAGDPLATGKPLANNFIPFGDMLRLNMAVPPTDRNDPAFSSLGLVQAAVLGLTDPTYASDASLQWIPNMDGFPNGRRLEDDVTRIELQAVSGVVLAAIGLWYDDFDPTDPTASPVTTDLLNVLSYTTGVEANDRPIGTSFPYMAWPHSGTGRCSGHEAGALINCDQPDRLSAKKVTATSAELRWSDEGLNRYKIKLRNLTAGGPAETYWSPYNNLVLSDLDPCSTYEFKVIVKCPVTGGFVSDTKTFTTTCPREGLNLMEATIFPNPVADQLNISYDLQIESKVYMRLVGADGNTLKEMLIEGSAGNNQYSVDISTLPSGMYFIQLRGGGEDIVKKFVRE